MREMKDIGAKWLGLIPNTWNIHKLKFSLRRNDTRKAGLHTVLSLYREFGVIPKDSRDDNHNVTSEDTSKYKFVQNGDFVINKMKAWQGSVGVSKYEGIVSPAYYVYNFINNDINKDYFHYLIRSTYKHEFRRLSGGIREGQWDLPSDALDNTVIIIPPLEEQRKIADFLDQKCSEIEVLTADIQTQIETLEEYKKSVIKEAVTKGLDPDVEMKDSGVEWIGEMPKSWCVIPVKFCFSITNGSDPSSNEGDTPVYGSGKGHFKTCKEFKKGPTVLLGRKGTVNIPQWIEGKYWNVDTAFDVHAKGNYLLKLFFYAASCFDYDNYSTQTALPSMTQSNYLNFRIPFMNVEEQHQIADFLDQKCSEIDQTISEKKQQLETLAEYKKSLIYECVTGKKEIA